MFLAVGIIYIRNILFRKSPCTSTLDGEDSCYLVAKERNSKNAAISTSYFPLALPAEPNST